MATKKGKTTSYVFPPLYFVDVESGIQDPESGIQGPGWKKIRIRDRGDLQ
jgi:hypothetical protein